MSYREYYRPSFSYSSCSNAVKCLVIINIAVFFVQKFMELVAGSGVYYIFGLVPSMLTGRGFIWQPVTYMFLHGGFMHLFINSFVLYMFGKPLEETWGSREFIKYYFICGIGAGLFITLTSLGGRVPTIGASGAVYGILAAYGIMYPDSMIYLYFIFPIKAKYFVILIGAIAFLSGLANPGSLISHFGHFGGLIVGLAYLKAGEIRDFFRTGFNFGSLRARARRGRMFDATKQRDNDGVTADEEVDRILDKILREGIDSLTPEERRIMDDYSSRGN